MVCTRWSIRGGEVNEFYKQLRYQAPRDATPHM
jgi:hypothetical protein